MWKPIETAPKGFELDIWSRREYKRYVDCFWGKPDSYKAQEDSKWCYYEYEIGWGWVAFAVPDPTHWTEIPSPPEEI